MSIWSQTMFQESTSLIMKSLSSFHDYSLAIIILILMFVTGASYSMTVNTLNSLPYDMTVVEIIWTILPMFILVFLVTPSLHILYNMEESKPFMTLKVSGHQWYWSYEMMDLEKEFDSYMKLQVKNGEFRLLDVDHRLILPTTKNIQALITSTDVLHCWAMPSLALKADAVPGRLNQVYINMTRSSILYGQCSEICGANHSFMPIVIESLSPNKFMKWCNEIK
nr:cytochrome c oxidase subunit 2 [Discoporella cookae]